MQTRKTKHKSHWIESLQSASIPNYPINYFLVFNLRVKTKSKKWHAWSAFIFGFIVVLAL